MDLELSQPVLYLCLLLSGLLWAVLGLGYKLADHHQCRTPAFARVFMVVAGLVCAIASTFERTAWGDWRLWALGVSVGLLFFVVILILMPAYRMGPASVIWIVVNLACLLPVFLSPLFREPLYWVDPILLLLFVLTLFAFQRGMAAAEDTVPATRAAFLLVLAGIFTANGTLLTGPKVQMLLFEGGSQFGYLTIFYFTGALITLVADLARREPLAPTRWEWRSGWLAGLSGAFGMLCFMKAITLPAAVVYTMNGGISLLGGVVLTTLIYKERLNAMKMVGLALGLLVVVLFSYREPLARLTLPPAAANTLTLPR